MFRRISGSSSMTSIFFMARSKRRKSHRYRRAFAESALDLQFPAVQVGAAFHQQQAKARARARADVAAAVERAEQVLLVLRRYADALVADHAHRVVSFARHVELHRGAGL